MHLVSHFEYASARMLINRVASKIVLLLLWLARVATQRYFSDSCASRNLRMDALAGSFGGPRRHTRRSCRPLVPSGSSLHIVEDSW